MGKSETISSIHTQLEDLSRLWDEIGHNADTRDERFATVSAELMQVCSKSISSAQSEKEALAEQCAHLERRVQDEAKLLGEEVDIPKNVAWCPLLERSKKLDEILASYQATRTERMNLLKETQQRLSEFWSATLGEESHLLEPEFQAVHDDSLLNYEETLKKFGDKLAELEQLKEDRIELLRCARESCLQLWDVLGGALPPSDDAEETVVDCILNDTLTENKAIGVTAKGLRSVHALLQNAHAEHSRRQVRADELKSAISDLFTKLHVSDEIRSEFEENFFHSLTGDTMRELESRYLALSAERKEKLSSLLDHAKSEIQEMWSKLYWTEEMGAAAFDFEFSTEGTITEEIVAAHEAEVIRLQGEYEKSQPILELYTAWRQLTRVRDQLTELTSNPDRFKDRHYDMKKENRMRMQVENKLPATRTSLLQKLSTYEKSAEGADPFCVLGKPLVDVIREDDIHVAAQKEEAMKRRKERRDREREKGIETPPRGKSTPTLTPRRASRKALDNVNVVVSHEAPTTPRA